MTPFSYARVPDVSSALAKLKPNGKFLGGGTNLVDLMKMGVENPAQLVDINRLALAEIKESPDGGVRIGALARNSDVAANPLIESRYPVLSQALLSGASPQLRNMATVGGNLLQRTRCYYFYDPAFPACNKRRPGSGCGALHGYNRIHAILGQSDHCIATHPSDMCVALAALEAVIHTQSPAGVRAIPVSEFHLLPGETPERETALLPDELIVSVALPPLSYSRRSYYLKVRDRASYAFALVSVAAAVEMASDGSILAVRIALGGVAHKPWRALEAEDQLVGGPATPLAFRAAAEVALAKARGYTHNRFKIELAKRAIVRALGAAASAA